MLLFGLPLLPFLSRLLFRSADFTLTEHLIFNTYVYAQQNLIFVALLPAFLLGGAVTRSVLYAASIKGYYVSACRGSFRLGLFTTLVRALVVMLLFSVAFMIGMWITA